MKKLSKLAAILLLPALSACQCDDDASGSERQEIIKALQGKKLKIENTIPNDPWDRKIFEITSSSDTSAKSNAAADISIALSDHISSGTQQRSEQSKLPRKENEATKVKNTAPGVVRVIYPYSEQNGDCVHNLTFYIFDMKEPAVADTPQAGSGQQQPPKHFFYFVQHDNPEKCGAHLTNAAPYTHNSSAGGGREIP